MMTIKKEKIPVVKYPLVCEKKPTPAHYNSIKPELELTVMFFSKNRGVVIDSNQPHKIGEHSDSWIEHDNSTGWVQIKDTKIILENQF